MRNRRGQSTAEYVLLGVVVVGALLAMSIYIKRGTMGNLRARSDQIGEQFTPFNASSNHTTTYTVTRDEDLEFNGAGTSNITTAETRIRTGEEKVELDLKGETVFSFP